MSRKKIVKKKLIKSDPIYNSIIASMLINRILLKGKKSLAQKIFYQTLTNIKETQKKDPIEVVKKAVENATPLIEVKTRRIGGATYQVPTEITQERGTSIALKIIIKSARNRPGKNICIKLENEIIDAYNNTGNSIKKKEEIHKIAEANKAFINLKF
jgi:small subunit ribosomal protein S7